ncbi:ABC transporter permease [Glaciimonas immobilis]|uniref:Osmoprotectant transport system permease protein n=1 Tax=Glaciimonas immobilis TaxID=728004 RepID=A0A840RQP9_9BURK|nr:ABC transporter permease [Glaciimonas immobilis]KAF3998004.1 ABC transporter permease [Glaciimonas immobilis]MBB5199316.1 osmoprotectant transport system permease protein [Glaciimonas immobilis]
MANRYRNAIVGASVTLMAVAGIGWTVGIDAIQHYQGDLIYYTMRHMQLVGWSMLLALATGLPAGILLSRPLVARHAEKFMQIFNIGNTIPSIAVLALALAVFGIGDKPSIIALWLASLLPIVRNTYEGLKQVPPALRDAARGVGMKPYQILFRVELPNAIPIIVGGIRTALAINVGTAPLSILIGGESLGSIIFPGIYLNNQDQLLLGATATALLALMLDAVVSIASNAYLTKRGLLR